ncbi:hypothetical protein AMTRI_Chr10g7490 [Amborella trichopoda]
MGFSESRPPKPNPEVNAKIRSSSLSSRSPPFSLEFRASDDAWYDVELSLENDALSMKFSVDLPVFMKYMVDYFEDLKKVNEFSERFRAVSTQLQDEECWTVLDGMTVCASQDLGQHGRKFFDALIKKVICARHTFVGREEICKCTFDVIWKAGPRAGKKGSIHIENICILQPGNAKNNPTLKSFLTACEKLISSKKEILETVDVNNMDGNCHADRNLVKNYSSAEKTEDNEDCNRVSVFIKAPEDLHTYYAIFIENLEPDLTASEIVDFIYEQTFVSCQACVSPSISTEVYAMGAIFLEKERDFNYVFGFLCDPGRMIVSLKGRPWVITEKECRSGTIGNASMFGLSSSKEENGVIIKRESCSKLKIVPKGVEEYEIGLKLKALFMEFQEHLGRLHERLAMEEKMIMI